MVESSSCFMLHDRMGSCGVYLGLFLFDVEHVMTDEKLLKMKIRAEQCKGLGDPRSTDKLIFQGHAILHPNSVQVERTDLSAMSVPELRDCIQ